MAISLSWHSRRTRTALIVLLLLVSLATASLIVLQAQYANASQRATVESVLHDYSSLVADEVIRRSSAEIGYYGYYPLVAAVLHEIQSSGKLPSTIRATLLLSLKATFPMTGFRGAQPPLAGNSRNNQSPHS